jgi:hypothetical protein
MGYNYPLLWIFYPLPEAEPRELKKWGTITRFYGFSDFFIFLDFLFFHFSDL